MFAIRSAAASSTRRLQPLLCRYNASLQSATEATSSSPPPPPAPPKDTSSSPENAAAADSATTKPTPRTPTRRRRRPNISLENPRTWNRPVPEGFIPAYDEALKFIQQDSAELKQELEGLRARIQALQAKGNELQDAEAEELEALRKKAEVVDIQSEINLPDVRWYFANGMADMNKLVYRHLAEQKWRNKGALDLLMERLHQMDVIPDILPDFHPSFDVRVSVPKAPSSRGPQRTRRYEPVEPGMFLSSLQTWRPPKLYTTVFHPETRYYTLVLVDADVPDPENQSYTTYLHWMQTNVPLSSTSPCPILPSYTHTRYIPPHPQRGTPYHRYCLFILPNPDPTQKISLPLIKDEERLRWSLREFCQKFGFDVQGVSGGAAHMWREKWDEGVGRVYKEVLKLPEPRFSLPPKRDPYEDAKSVDKFATK